MDVSIPPEVTEVSKEAEVAMATPTSFGEKPLPKRNSTARTLIPMSWIGREVTVERLDHAGKIDTHRGKLLDICGLGVVLCVSGGAGRMIVPWERVGLLELAA